MTPSTESPAAATTETWTYADFAAKAEQLLAPLASLMQPGESHLPIEGPPSDHGEAADRFEAFARPMLLAALWLHSNQHTSAEHRTLDPEPIADWFRDGLVLGTDPGSDKFWGVLPSFHQFAVEMAILVMALDIAEDHLWTPLAEDEKRQVADWLGQIRGHAGHHNNHLFFDLLVLEFLGDRGFGTPEDRPCIDWLFAELETMHRKDGWFIDGTNENYDHYNAYAFHIYGLYWARRYGHANPSRANRWKQWAARFIPDYARFFSARGEPVPFGRSLTYRFNGVGVFPLAADLGIDTLDPGVMRRLCRKCIGFFTASDTGQSQGCMSIGWTDEFKGLAEPYSCAGSPYWAAKGLLMLTLDPDHPFFSAPEQPLPSETDAEPIVIAAPGYVVRNITAQTAGEPDNAPGPGDVELINAGGWSSLSAAQRFGQWKWGRIAFRTGVGSLYPESPDVIPPDAGLTARRPDSDRWFGRHKTIPLHVDERHLAAAYTLSVPKSGFNVGVVTRVWWNGAALFQVHKIQAYQATVIRSGAFAISGSSEPLELIVHQPPALGASNARQSTSIRVIAGWTRSALLTESTDARRAHLYGPGSAVPTLEAEIGIGVHHFAEVLWTGRDGSDDPGWHPLETNSQDWVLKSGKGEVWDIGPR